MESFSQANQEAIVFIEKNQKSAWFNKAAAALLLLPDDTSDPTLIIEALNSLSKNSINASETEEQLPRLLTENIKDEEFKLHIQYANYSISITYASISWGHMDGSLWLLKKNIQNTDSELAKSQIHELSNLLNSVLNSSLSGIMAFRTIRDDKNNIIDFECLIVNEKAKKLLKKKEYELIGESLRNIFPVYLKDDLFDQYKGVVETGNSIYLEQSQDINGYKTWSNINVVKLEDGLAVIFTDITTRKNAEEKLKRNQAKLKAVLENTNDFIWSFNNEYLITTINTAFQEKVFHQTGQILKVGNKFDLNIFPKDVIPQWEGYFNRAFLGERFTEEVKIKVLEAEYFLEYSFNPIKDREQNIIGVAIFGRDISKRRKAEREIRQKSQMLNSLLNNLPVFVFRLDQEGRIIEAMGAALKNLNIREDMILNIKAEELFPEVKKAFKKVKKGKSVKFQSSKTHEGQECVFEKFIFPDETNVGGAIGFAMDVTDLKKIEMELQSAKESAERAIKAKNYFLANMSHDLRTPIHTILGFARELQGNINSSDAVKYLHYIISSGELLYKLVDDILELTKIEEGKLHLKEEPFNFEETLLSNLYPYQFQANEKGLDFKIHFDDNLPKYCIGDAGKISRIIINIIGNSLKFTEKGYIHLSFSSLN
ncbi:MAG: PAS domain-containing protein, partial [Bacteroidota bacterium]|nr:PAS domain-containing protein [Bacteroidota bacterium]